LVEVSDRPLSIEEVAREAAMSPFHFIRQFNAPFGRTPHQCRIDARLDRAKRLLALGDHSIADVCFEVGLSSLGSFSDLFARRVGISPSVYRRRIRTMVAGPGLQAQLFPGCLLLMGAAFSTFEKR
jgi:AraC-like DNA-binding protein